MGVWRCTEKLGATRLRKGAYAGRKALGDARSITPVMEEMNLPRCYDANDMRGTYKNTQDMDILVV